MVLSEPLPTPHLIADRLTLRRWTDQDREPFAQLNTDVEVMRYFREPLDRAASDSFIDRIETAFDELGYGLWAVEVRASGAFIGFTGLALQTFEAPFTPAVEIGWRLARSAWGHGYATEAAQAAIEFGFGTVGLTEIVSMTSVTNERSRAVMRRLGMTRDPADDFDYPRHPVGHPLRPHVLYRIARSRCDPQDAAGRKDNDGHARGS
ncbi:MAG: GNAT family N-acetyltransferase [Actinomycetota bacterium]|nr:GNAT family N-acetyltransferase [Actinomycetota bacterium]